jgi:hypothetical protein
VSLADVRAARDRIRGVVIDLAKFAELVAGG